MSNLNNLPESQQDNVDDVLGLNINVDQDSNLVPIKPLRVSRPRYLKDTHLTSIRGLPYLRKSAKNRLRKTLNHKNEYKNLTNFLSFYQIWGHNLFPKAKFPDFVEMCSTAGKERTVKFMRRSFIDEDLGIMQDEERREMYVLNTDMSVGRDGDDGSARIDVVERAPVQQNEDIEDVPDEEFAWMDMDRARGEIEKKAAEKETQTAYVAEENQTGSALRKTTPPTGAQDPNSSTLAFGDDNDDFDDDDDDDLFAAVGTTTQKKPQSTSTQEEPPMDELDSTNFEDQYADEMDFLREQGL